MCIVQCNVDNEPRIKLNYNIEGPARFPQFVNAGLCSSSARGLRLLTFVCGRLEKLIFAECLRAGNPRIHSWGL